MAQETQDFRALVRRHGGTITPPPTTRSRIADLVRKHGGTITGRPPGGVTRTFGQLPPASFLERFRDWQITATKAAIRVPESAVGLAELGIKASEVLSGRALFMEPTPSVGKLLEDAGFQPKLAREVLDTYYSEQQQRANRSVAEAEGMLATAKAAINNPSTIAHAVVESAPLMLMGGAGARALAVRGMRAVTAGAVGEGAVSAGATTEEVRAAGADLTMAQAGLSAVSGGLTGALSLAGGRLAQKLGIADIETMLAAGSLDGTTRRNLVQRLIFGAIQEGGFEEFPQSIQEQILQNQATGRPLPEGVNQAAVMGAFAGAAMGVGVQAVARPARPAGPPAQPPPTRPPAGVPPVSRAAEQAEADARARLRDRGTFAPPSPPAVTEAQPAVPAAPVVADLVAQHGGTLTPPPVAPTVEPYAPQARQEPVGGVTERPPVDAGAPPVVEGGVQPRPRARRPQVPEVSPADQLFTELLADAQAQNYPGTPEDLRQAFDERVDFLRAGDGAFVEAGRDPMTLLREVAAAGGIGADPTFPGEIAWLREEADLTQRGRSTGRNLGGVGGVFARDGKTLGGMVEHLRQDPRFDHITSSDDLIEELVAAARQSGTAPLSMRELRRAGVQPGTPWWEDEGDVSFEAVPTSAEPAQPVPTADVLDTGEVQPRLPGAEAVRDVDIPTPEVAAAPFALVPEAAERAQVQPTLPEPPAAEAPVPIPAAPAEPAPAVAPAAAEPGPTPSRTEKATAILDRAEDAARTRLTKRGTIGGTRLGAGLPVEDMLDLSVIGAAKIARGTIDFAQWSTEMVREFGEQIRQHLEAIYERATRRANTVVEETLERAPRFYNTLETLLDTKMPRRAIAGDVLNLIKKGGITEDELKWSGLQPWLEGRGPVLKADVLAFVQANQIRVEEVELTERPWSTSDSEALDRAEDQVLSVLVSENEGTPRARAKLIDDIDSNIEAGREPTSGWDLTQFSETSRTAIDGYADVRIRMRRRPTKFQQYQLPGGENYRELAITLPQPVLPLHVSEIRPFADEGVGMYEGRHRVEGVRESTFTIGAESGRITYWPVTYNAAGNRLPAKYIVNSPHMQNARFNSIEAAKAAIEANARGGGLGGDYIARARQDVFRGGHFEEPNVLAHIRFNDRTVADRTMLFIEEVQSDWHQKGRREGYRDVVTEERRERRQKAYEDARHEARRVLKKFDDLGFDITSQAVHAVYSSPDWRTRYDWTRATDEDMEILGRLYETYHDESRLTTDVSGAVPDAPFKTTWPEIAMKRMLRYAADGGYDSLGWTTGEQQVTRYEEALREAVDRIEWTKTPQGVHLVGKKLVPGGKMSERGRVVEDWEEVVNTTEKETVLSDAIGKAMAKQVLESSEQSGVFEGDDIKIDDTGMAVFYDQILPGFLRKYGKPWGLKVGTTQIALEVTVPEARRRGIEVTTEKPLEATEAVNAVDLTPAMRRSVVYEGQPQFGRAARLTDIFDRVEQGAKGRIRERGTLTGTRLATGLPLEDMADLVLIGTAKLGKGTVQFAEFSREMLAEFGDQIQPHLQTIYDQAQSRVTVMADFDPEEYFNFRRVTLSEPEQQALTALVQETVIRTGRVPKERTTFQEIRDEARALHPDAPKLLAPFMAAQGPYRAVRMAARQRINAVNRQVILARQELVGLPEEEVLERERNIQAMETDVRGLLDIWMRMRSEDGRNLAMHRMMADSSWEDGRGFDHAYWLSRARRSMGLPHGVEMPLKVHQDLNEILSRGDEAARTGQNVVAVQQELADFLMKLDQSSWWDIVQAVRKAGMLTGFRTHGRNLGGTFSFQVLEELSRAPSAAVDMAVSVGTGRRAVQGISPTAIRHATYEAATRGVREALEIMKRGTTAHELLKVGVRRELNSGIGWLDTYTNFVFRTMTAEDRVFKSYAFRRSLEEQAALQAINYGVSPIELLAVPSEEMIRQGVADAEFATFNNRHLLGRLVRYAQAEATRYGVAGQSVSFAIDMQVPFANTPANLVSRMLDYTPIGMLAKGGTSVVRSITNRAMKPAEQRAFSQAMGRGMTGSALMTLGWKLGALGLLTGIGGEDPSDRTVQRAAGRLLGALRVGGRWHQIGAFSPLGNLMIVGASLQRQQTRPLREEAMRLGKLAGVATRTMMEQPMLRGMKDLVEALSEEAGSRTEYAISSTLGSFIPTLVSDAASLFDPYRREARPEGMRQSLFNGIQNRLPGLRQYLPARETVFGRQETQTYIALWSPTIATVARELDDDVLRELIKHDVGVGWPNRKVGESREDYRRRASVVGKHIKARVERLLQNSAYQDMDAEQQKSQLEDMISRARRDLAPYYPVTEEDQKTIETRYGLPPTTPQPMGVGATP